NEALLGGAHIPQEHVETGVVELAIYRLQVRVGRDVAGDFAVGNAQSHLARALIESGLADHLAKDRAVEAPGLRLTGGKRVPEFAADLLQLVVIGLTKLIGRNFGRADS